MALTVADFQSRFKKLGKLIYISQQSPIYATSVKRQHVALVDQQANMEDPPTEFDINDQVVTPIGNELKKVTDSLNAVPSKVKSAVSTYLLKFLAADLGLATTGQTYAQVGTALATQMTTAVASVAVWNLTTNTNLNGLGAYLEKNFGIVVPSSGAPNLLDTYVTDNVL